MSDLTPKMGAVLLRLKWRDATGRVRYTVGSLAYNGAIQIEYGTTAQTPTTYFEGFMPLNEIAGLA